MTLVTAEKRKDPGCCAFGLVGFGSAGEGCVLQRGLVVLRAWLVRAIQLSLESSPGFREPTFLR